MMVLSLSLSLALAFVVLVVLCRCRWLLDDDADCRLRFPSHHTITFFFSFFPKFSLLVGKPDGTFSELYMSSSSSSSASLSASDKVHVMMMIRMIMR